jgi:hypothetical protein
VLLLHLGVYSEDIYMKSFFKIISKTPGTLQSFQEFSLHFKAPVIQIISLGNSTNNLGLQRKHSSPLGE